MPPFRLALPGLLLCTPLLSAAAPAMPSDHWSFRPIRRPALPTPPVSPPGKGGIQGGWVRNPHPNQFKGEGAKREAPA